LSVVPAAMQRINKFLSSGKITPVKPIIQENKLMIIQRIFNLLDVISYL
jgi:hypothetical protein